MILKYQIIPLFFCILSPFCSPSKYNLSPTNLETCQEYYITSRGYKYVDFFKVSSMKNATNDNQRLHLNFYVMTSRDAHILLSEVENITVANGKHSDRVYVIVLGGYRNSQSDIRLEDAGAIVATNSTPNLLSVFDPMPVEIIQTIDGVLLVNVPGYAEPLMNYSNTNPLNIKFFSFGTYDNNSAKWFYDCQLDELMKLEKCKPNQDAVTTEIPDHPKQENPVEVNNMDKIKHKNITNRVVDLSEKKQINLIYVLASLLLAVIIGICFGVAIMYCCQRSTSCRKNVKYRVSYVD